VDEAPHEARHQHRIISTDVSGVLPLDERFDQHVEGSIGLGNEVILFCGRLDESAEHHPVVGWMRDRELHRCLAHGLKADAAGPILFPGIGDGLAERAEPFLPYRRQQGLLISEMPIERVAGTAPSCSFLQSLLFHPRLFNALRPEFWTPGTSL
jgi:hypothetical protein